MSELGPAQTKLPHATKALVLLLALNLLNYADRQVLNAMSPIVIGEFKISEETFGWTTSAFIYAMMIGAPLLGQLSLRMSRWWLISGCVVVWSVASGFCLSGGMALGFGFLLTMRVIVGIGEAGYGPTAPTLLSDYFPPRLRGRVLSTFYVAIPVGSALGYIYGGLMVPHWRWAFILMMPFGLTMAVLCFLMKDPRERARATGKKLEPAHVDKGHFDKRPANAELVNVNQDYIGESPTSVVTAHGTAKEDVPESFFATVKKLLRIPSYVANTAAMTAMTFVIGGMAAWTIYYITLRKMTQDGFAPMLAFSPQSGEFQMAVAHQKLVLADVSWNFGIIIVVAGILATVLGGLMGEWLRPKIRGAYLYVSGGAILFAFPCMLAMIYLPFPYAWWAVFGAVFFLFFNTGPANTALAGVTNSAMRGPAFALNIFTIHAFGDALSPPLIGALARYTSWNQAFLIVSPLVLVASAFWIIGARYLHRDELRAEGLPDPEATPA